MKLITKKFYTLKNPFFPTRKVYVEPCTSLWQKSICVTFVVDSGKIYPCHTQGLLIAASFRTWRGSQSYVAWDPAINTTCIGQTKQIKSLCEEFNPAIADCRLQGTANSPASTAMAEKVGFEPTIEFPLYTRSRRAPSTTRTSLHITYLEIN